MLNSGLHIFNVERNSKLDQVKLVVYFFFEKDFLLFVFKVLQFSNNRSTFAFLCCSDRILLRSILVFRPLWSVTWRSWQASIRETYKRNIVLFTFKVYLLCVFWVCLSLSWHESSSPPLVSPIGPRVISRSTREKLSWRIDLLFF